MMIVVAALVLTSVPHFAPSIDLLPTHVQSSRLANKFLPSSSEDSSSHTLSVPLDWSHPSEDLFSIRFFTDTTAFDPANVSAPIFVAMGGEGTARGVRCNSLAKRLSALCVGVEHRFYGKSVPASGPSTANYWAGLSVEANLADTRAVIQLMQTTHGPKRPVIAFGGSYSGATCAWLRQSYPSDVQGCVSSSGVVNALVDYPQFDTHIGHALGANCSSALAAAYIAIDAAFDAGGGDEVKKLFNASNLIGTLLGDTDFMYAAADGPAMMDQYGDKADLCAGLALLPPQPTARQRIVNLARVVQQHYGPSFASECFYDSECVQSAARLPTLNSLAALNARSWRFEKCSEVAYLQSAPLSGQRLRSKRLTIASLLEQCEYIFGSGTNDRMRARNGRLQANFGGALPATGKSPASEIFYLDFSDDPWAEASVKGETAHDLPFCLTTCDGCGHCGAGVPANLTKCFDASDAWVEKVLREATQVKPEVQGEEEAEVEAEVEAEADVEAKTEEQVEASADSALLSYEDRTKEFKLVKLTNAKCIDGTPASYYIARNASSSSWVLWLQGGGICRSLLDCQQRAMGPLGSSSSYASSIDAPKGMLSSDPSINPRLSSWNRVYLPYCSGDVWAGTTPKALNPFPQQGAWAGYFHGHTIIEELINDLEQKHDAKKSASEAVLTGCSAGGVGTLHNCDFFASQFPSAESACRPEAGWFGLAQATYSFFDAGRPDLDPDPRKLATSNWTQNIAPYISPGGQRCAADVRSGKRAIDHCDGQKYGPAWCCYMPPLVYAYATTRMFISENTADAYQIFSAGLCPRTEHSCAAGALEKRHTAYWDYIRDTISASLTVYVLNGPKRQQDGLWAPACLVHCMSRWQGSVSIAGKTDQQAFDDWYFRRAGNHLQMDNSSSPSTLCQCAQQAGVGADEYHTCASGGDWYV